MAEKKQESAEREEDESHPDYQCGWFGVRPKFLQMLRTPKGALFFLCLGSIMEGLVVNGLLNVVLSTLERRFNLSSKASGMIRATNSISQMIATFPMSYFGGKGCKPRYLGVGIFTLGIGALIFSLPHFLSGTYQPSVTSDGGDSLILCGESNSSSATDSIRETSDDFSHLTNLFFLGQILHGVGSAPLWTIGVTYLDDNLPSSTSPLYVGIFYAFAVIGPAIGFLGGGQLLQIHTDFDTIIDSPIDSDHPNWVGLWWLGFVFAGFFSMLIGFLLFSFPAKLPGWKKIQEEKQKEAGQIEKSSFLDEKKKAELAEKENNDGVPFAERVLKPIYDDVGTLFSNSTYMCICFNQTTEGLVFAIFSAFMPKFLESQFQLTSSDAAFYVGIIIVFLGSFGMVMGGWVVKHFNLTTKSILLFVSFAAIFQLPQLLAYPLLYCDNGLFSGIDYPTAFQKEEIPALSQMCNSGCACGGKFDPVCGSNNVLFYSPCHAGCQQQLHNSTWDFADCSCVKNLTDLSSLTGTARGGRCSSNEGCKERQLYPFLFLFALVIFPMLSITAPAMQATLRSVPARLTSIAIGLQLVMSRSLGAVPGPPIFGAVVDSVCLVSQTTSTEEENACAIYDQKNLGLLMFFIAATIKTLSFVFIFAAWFFYRTNLKRNAVKKEADPNANGSEYEITSSTKL